MKITNESVKKAMDAFKTVVNKAKFKPAKAVLVRDANGQWTEVKL